MLARELTSVDCSRHCGPSTAKDRLPNIVLVDGTSSIINVL